MRAIRVHTMMAQSETIGLVGISPIRRARSMLKSSRPVDAPAAQPATTALTRAAPPSAQFHEGDLRVLHKIVVHIDAAGFDAHPSSSLFIFRCPTYLTGSATMLWRSGCGSVCGGGPRSECMNANSIAPHSGITVGRWVRQSRTRPLTEKVPVLWVLRDFPSTVRPIEERSVVAPIISIHQTRPQCEVSCVQFEHFPNQKCSFCPAGGHWT
jgi:hypothetical protein